MRYALYKGSQSAHCCFEYTVVDTTKPYLIGEEHYKDSSGQYHYETVCECFSQKDAEMVMNALNRSEGCQCIDCGGSEGSHSPNCEYMLELTR